MEKIEELKKKREEKVEKKNKESREHYKNNREKLLEKKTEKIECQCGGHYQKTNKCVHILTLRHIKYLEKLEEMHK
jgi:hypothetical protein